MVGDWGNPNLQTREIGRYMVPRQAVLYSSVQEFLLKIFSISSCQSTSA